MPRSLLKTAHPPSYGKSCRDLPGTAFIGFRNHVLDSSRSQFHKRFIKCSASSFHILIVSSSSFRLRKSSRAAASKTLRPTGEKIKLEFLNLRPNLGNVGIIKNGFILPPLSAPLAQLDRASGYEPEGREFESLRAHHF